MSYYELVRAENLNKKLFIVNVMLFNVLEHIDFYFNKEI